MTLLALPDGTARACGCTMPTEPSDTTPVLHHRKLLPGTEPSSMSVFGDEVWNLTPGVFEAHAKAVSLNFAPRPAALRHATKLYFWHLINHRTPAPLRRATTSRLSLQSLPNSLGQLTVFLTWLDTRAIDSFDQVNPAHLDQFLDDVRHTEHSAAHKRDVLTEIRRLWCYRTLLPEPMRLCPQPPWDGDDNIDLIGPGRAHRENATPRIHPDTMQPLLMWSLRFVEDFADDIIAAFAEYQRLAGRGPRQRRTANQPRRRDNQAWLAPVLADWLAERLKQNTALPGAEQPDGSREVNWAHLARVLDCGARNFAPGRRARAMVLSSGVPIARTAGLDTPITGRVHEHPWLDEPISYHQAPQLARLLSAAAAVVISYLSGMRPGELLSLERGCLDHDPATQLWSIRGQQWKGVVDEDGEKLPEGAARADPWTTIGVVARAVETLERLHPHPLLFPSELRARGSSTGRTQRVQPVLARTDSNCALAIEELTNWVNHYCQGHGLVEERIPADPQGRLSLSRFRRTLAWHIVRRPRGLIAGAIQYGHLHIRVTLGYAGSYESGFPDDHAYEDWLLRLEQLHEHEQRLAAGEHVSGPAADTYRHRVHTAHAKFAGRVLTSTRQARDLLDNPLLQIFPGRAMTCVLDPNKALCQLHSTDNGTHRTPDTSDCQPRCQNLAFTTSNIAALQARADRLRDIVSDPLAPAIRTARDRHELDRITTILRRHHQGS